MELADNTNRGLSHFGHDKNKSAKNRKAIHLVTKIREDILKEFIAEGFQLGNYAKSSEFNNTVDFGYKERGYKEQPLIWNKCQRDGFFT